MVVLLLPLARTLRFSIHLSVLRYEQEEASEGTPPAHLLLLLFLIFLNSRRTKSVELRPSPRFVRAKCFCSCSFVNSDNTISVDKLSMIHEKSWCWCAQASERGFSSRRFSGSVYNEWHSRFCREVWQNRGEARRIVYKARVPYFLTFWENNTHIDILWKFERRNTRRKNFGEIALLKTAIIFDRLRRNCKRMLRLRR